MLVKNDTNFHLNNTGWTKEVPNSDQGHSGAQNF